MCSNNFEFLTDKTSNMKYLNLYAEFRFLYFISTPFNRLLLRFWFYLRYKIISMFYLTFTLLSFNLLHFISTPSNCSPTCIWFYLRYKIISTFYLTFTLLSFNLLRFISTPSNCSPTCVWFYLRYKIRKLYKAQCCPSPMF